MVTDWHGGMVCSLCARGPTAARPPTAEEAGDHRLLKPNLTDYFTGVYAVGYPDRKSD